MNKLERLASPLALTPLIHHLEVDLGHGRYPQKTQVHVEGLKI